MPINLMPWRRQQSFARWRNVLGIWCLFILLLSVALYYFNGWIDRRIAVAKHHLSMRETELLLAKRKKPVEQSSAAVLSVLKQLKAAYWQQQALLIRLFSVLTVVPAAVALTKCHVGLDSAVLFGVTPVLSNFWWLYRQLSRHYRLSLKALSYSDHVYHFEVQLGVLR